MKLLNNEFRCEWCAEVTIKKPVKDMSAKNVTPYGQVICSSCGRHISQKTKLEMEK